MSYTKLFKTLVTSSSQDEPNLLVCIYTCQTHDHLLEEFYSSPVMRLLRERENTQIIEVRADESLQSDQLKEDCLTLRTREHYNNLPNKSFAMIRYLVNNVDFEYLLKIDVTTLTTVIRDKLLTGGKPVSEEALIGLISEPSFYRDYNGFAQLNAKRPGAENWAKKKNIVIDYDKVFESDLLPPFFTGKMWLLERSFAEYIAKNGSATVANFTKNFPAEDVMIGTLYKRFVNADYGREKGWRVFNKMWRALIRS